MKTLKVLVACETQGFIRDAFLARGHHAFSIDTRPCETGSPWHIQDDVRSWLERDWDLIIAYPPPRHLSASGARWWKEKEKRGILQPAVDFFLLFTKLKCPRVCIENPRGIMTRLYRRPDQNIQPYQFGDNAMKETHLWLKGLPFLPINPHRRVKGRMVNDLERWRNQCDSGAVSNYKAGNVRFPGIARAMAETWG